jgi:hypothetical protein
MPFLFQASQDAQDTEEATQELATEPLEEPDNGSSQGLSGFWKPVIARLQKRGWTDAPIAGTLGGTEELFFSGVLVSLGSFVLTHFFGFSLPHALAMTSAFSAVLFPLVHWKERYRLIDGQLRLAPAGDRKRDLIILLVLGSVLRLGYAVLLNQLPFALGNLVALPMAIWAHAAFNLRGAPRLKPILALLKSA